MTESAALLVDEVLPKEPLRQWALSAPFPLRYLFATDPVAMGAVLGIVYRAIAAHLVRKAGFTQRRGRTGAVTLIQRFGSALNLNIHFHLLVLDGAYELTAAGLRFRRVAPPTSIELEGLLERIVTRIAGHLERRGLLVRDAENAYLGTGPGEDSTLEGLIGHSITYRIALGPNEGRKAFTLQTLAPTVEAPSGEQRLKRVFRIDIDTCERCGGKVRIIASIEDPVVVGRILSHLEQTERRRAAPADADTAHRARAPPGQGGTRSRLRTPGVRERGARRGRLRQRSPAVRESGPHAGISGSATGRWIARPPLPRLAGCAAGGYTAGTMGFERPILRQDDDQREACL